MAAGRLSRNGGSAFFTNNALDTDRSSLDRAVEGAARYAPVTYLIGQ
jgi:hypothetical protein